MKFIFFLGLAWFIFFRKPGTKNTNGYMGKFNNRFEAEDILFNQDGFKKEDIKQRSSNANETNITYNDGYEVKITKNENHKAKDW